MLSNSYCYDSCGSDSSDSQSDHSSHPRNRSLSRGLTAQLDHNYTPEPTVRSTNTSINKYFNRFNPLMECLNTNLFGEEELQEMAAYCEDDFMNAPTPRMPILDLLDIEENDLLNFVGAYSQPVVDNNNNTTAFQFNVFNEEVVIGGTPMKTETIVQPEPYSLSYASVQQSTEERAVPSKMTTRKRHLPYVEEEEEYDNEEEEEEDFEDDKSSVVTEVHTKTKGTPGRKPSKNNKCMSKNAIAARENREKKKKIFDEMQRRLTSAETDVKRLRTEDHKQKELIAKQSQEINYLKAVIANDTQISSIVAHMATVPNLPLIGAHYVSAEEMAAKSLKKSVNSESSDDKNVRKSSRIAAKGDSPLGASKSPDILSFNSDGPGICFHIKGNRMSLELCRKCSDNVSKKHSKKGK